MKGVGPSLRLANYAHKWSGPLSLKSNIDMATIVGPDTGVKANLKTPKPINE